MNNPKKSPEEIANEITEHDDVDLPHGESCLFCSMNNRIKDSLMAERSEIERLEKEIDRYKKIFMPISYMTLAEINASQPNFCKSETKCPHCRMIIYQAIIPHNQDDYEIGMKIMQPRINRLENELKKIETKDCAYCDCSFVAKQALGLKP